jgi:hypothetical protein
MRGVGTLCIKQYGECRLVVFGYNSKELYPAMNEEGSRNSPHKTVDGVSTLRY